MAYSSAMIWLYDKWLVTGVVAEDTRHKESALLPYCFWKLRFYQYAKGNWSRASVNITCKKNLKRCRSWQNYYQQLLSDYWTNDFIIPWERMGLMAYFRWGVKLTSWVPLVLNYPINLLAWMEIQSQNLDPNTSQNTLDNPVLISASFMS